MDRPRAKHRRGLGLLITTMLAIVLLRGGTARAETVRHQDPEFSLTVPAGFQILKAPLSPPALYAFATSDPAMKTPETAVVVARLNATIDQNTPPVPSVIVGGAHLIKANWNGLRLDVVAGRRTEAGQTFSVRFVKIPLKEEAIEVALTEPVARESSIDADLDKWLAGITGQSNWRSAQDRADRAAYAAILCGLPLVVGLVSLVVLIVTGRARNRRLKLRPVPDGKKARHAIAMRAGKWAGTLGLIVASLSSMGLVLARVRDDFLVDKIVDETQWWFMELATSTMFWGFGWYGSSEWIQQLKKGRLDKTGRPLNVVAPPTPPSAEESFVIVDDT